MSHLGNTLIFVATACTAASTIVYLLAWRGREDLVSLGRRLYGVSTGVVTMAMLVLLYQIVTHDFTNTYVFQYSSTDLPVSYLVSVLWAGQEGTFLLWIFFAGVFGLFMMVRAAEFERGNMVWLNLFILSVLIILLKRSPFEVMSDYALEGNGLNPLLQSFWMTIHPPIMFVGYAAVTIPFCFALTGLVERRYDTWAESARKWTIFAWSGLGVSLVLGGYWAYETLGWGGFWAWDPVENASLIPWMFLTAQVHTLFVKRHRRGLMRFSLAMVLLSFWSVLYGTFLTRSGVLADFSVHSFVNVGINQLMVGGLVFFVVLGCFWLALRWKDIATEASFSSVNSRSYLTALGIVVLFVGGVLVLLGTSAPLLTWFSDNPSTVDLSYYFTTMTPVAIVLLILLVLFPVVRWDRGFHKPVLLTVGSLAFVITTVILLGYGTTNDITYLLLFGTAAAAIVTNGYVLVQSWVGGRFRPGYLSHVGLALALIGAGASAGFETKQQVTLLSDELVKSEGFDLTYIGTTETSKGFDCRVTIDKDSDNFVAVLPHEFSGNEGVMKKPFVRSYLLYDLYLSPIVLEQAEPDDPGTLFLRKGETATLDKYKIKFIDFEMGDHGEGISTGITAGARLEITYDGRTEKLQPHLKVLGDQITPHAVLFDNARGEVIIAGLRPEAGGVVLKVSGAFLPPADVSPESLVVELSIKPLISLFWVGTFLTFAGGLVAMKDYRGRR